MGGGAVSDNSQVYQLHSHNPSQAARETLQLSGCCTIQMYWITQSTQQLQTDVSENRTVNFSRQVGIVLQIRRTSELQYIGTSQQGISPAFLHLKNV